MCGKALPFRKVCSYFSEAAPQIRHSLDMIKQSGKAEPFRTSDGKPETKIVVDLSVA